MAVFFLFFSPSRLAVYLLPAHPLLTFFTYFAREKRERWVRQRRRHARLSVIYDAFPTSNRLAWKRGRRIKNVSCWMEKAVIPNPWCIDAALRSTLLYIQHSFQFPGTTYPISQKLHSARGANEECTISPSPTLPPPAPQPCTLLLLLTTSHAETAL